MNAMTVPFAQYTDVVRPEWIDQNDHLNSSHYKTITNNSTRQLFALLRADLTPDELARSSVFQAEIHMCYHRELRLGDVFSVRTWVVGADPKRIHLFHEVIGPDGVTRVASVEQMMLHMDMQQRRVSAMPGRMYECLCALLAEHVRHGLPEGIGRHISMPQTN